MKVQQRETTTPQRRYLRTSLPILQLDVEIGQTCKGKDTCSTCTLHQTWCNGRRAGGCGLQTSCSTQCNTCSGNASSRPTQGVCCKSPLGKYAIEQITRWPELNYVKHKPLKFPHERIPLIHHRNHRSHAPVNCVALYNVFSMRGGWRSKDIKDYLKLPKDSTLILSTIMDDNKVENMTDAPWWEEARAVGFDYWMPMLQSMYGDSSNMNRIWARYRTCASQADAGAHFAPLIAADDARSEMVAQEGWRALSAAKNVIIDLSFGSNSKDHEAYWTPRLKKYRDQLLPYSVFVQGATQKWRRDAIKHFLQRTEGIYFFVSQDPAKLRTDDPFGWYDANA